MSKFFSLFAALFVFVGCVTSNHKTIETKYVPGDCATPTPELIKERGEPELQNVAMLVLGVTKSGYVIVESFKGEVSTRPYEVAKIDLDTQTTSTICPPVFATKEQTGEEESK